ncbi:hypothetical protein [Homoserinimonas sp. OAct 916]|uniref:hypothetical protein n=1 Tax=Homoserinimonas sp. OAct 916 TaxID=2211450 RepID=UPI001E3D29B2|nr:hypothetical protein [Homoserinimonas sp. OAct 916]
MTRAMNSALCGRNPCTLAPGARKRPPLNSVAVMNGSTTDTSTPLPASSRRVTALSVLIADFVAA